MASKAKTKKFAVETYYRDSNGKLVVVLVDAATGQPIIDSKGYRVVTQEQLDAGVLGLGDLNTFDDGDADTGADDADVSFGSNVRIPEYGRGKRDGGFGGKGKFTRDASNNYGFRSTPLGVKLAGLVPGPVGLAGKAVGFGMRLNNRAATDALAKDMNLDPKQETSFLDKIGNLISGGDEGYAGEAKIGKNSYGVSLGDTRITSGGGVVNGRTTLTPNEAQTRRSMAALQDKSTAKDSKKSTSNIRSDVTDSRAPTTGKAGTVAGWDRSNLSTDTQGILDGLAEAGFGGLAVNSGARTPSKNKAVRGAKNSQHLTKDAHGHPVESGGIGNAVDISFAGLTDQQKTEALDAALASGAQGVGISIDRTGMHFDPRDTKTMWGYKNGDDVKATVADLPGWAQGVMGTFMSQSNGVYTPLGVDATPKSRPANPNASAVVGLQGPTARSGFSTVAGAAQQQIDQARRDSVARAIIDQAKVPSLNKLGFNPYTASPAQLANAGLRQKSPAQQNAINLAIAGELSPSTLKGLANDDPTALAEYANIRTTIENRLAKVGDLGTVLDGSQYNSMLSKNLPTTVSNYETYKDALNKAYAGFEMGTIKPTNPNANSYYNPDLVKPDWSNPSFGIVGEHTFGSVSNWSKYSQDFYKDREAIANKANLASPQGYSGAFGNFGRTDTPSSGRSVFGGGSNRPASSANYSGMGGQNSPSEGAGHFGGSGLGTPGMGTKQGSNFGRGDTPSSGRSGSSSFGGSTAGKGSPSAYGGGFSGSSSGSNSGSTAGKGNPSGYGGGFSGSSSSTKSDKSDSHAARAGF